jgi:hypothetical protein
VLDAQGAYRASHIGASYTASGLTAGAEYLIEAHDLNDTTKQPYLQRHTATNAGTVVNVDFDAASGGGGGGSGGAIGVASMSAVSLTATSA